MRGGGLGGRRSGGEGVDMEVDDHGGRRVDLEVDDHGGRGWIWRSTIIGWGVDLDSSESVALAPSLET